jgi:hypothetical protein
MYTSKIYFVMWFKDHLDLLPHSFIFTQIISQIFITFLVPVSTLWSWHLSRPPKEVCCGLHPLINQRGAPTLVKTPAASFWPSPCRTVPSTWERETILQLVSQEVLCPIALRVILCFLCASFFLFSVLVSTSWSWPLGPVLQKRCAAGYTPL